MSRNIEFGVQTGEFGTNLSISGPSTSLRLSTKHREPAKPAFEHKVFRFDKVKAGTRASQDIGELTLLGTKLAKVVGGERKAVLQAALDYLYFVGSGQAERLDVDPDIIIHEALATSSTDEPAVTVKALDLSDPKAVEDAALPAMTGMAGNLRYTRFPLTEVLSVSADEQSGLAIGADNLPRNGLTTVDYSSDSGFVHLYNEGPARPAQQLTALAGAIAIVRTNPVA